MIEHVFVLMLENRSFDHMLGYSGLTGTDAASGSATAITGLSGSESNRLPSGARAAVQEGADFVLGVDPGHDFDDVLEQLCGPGAAYPAPGGGYPVIDNSGFASRLAARAPDLDAAAVMRAFRPDQLPVLSTLAREFAVCDQWFSAMPGPTWPNRLFAHAASSAGLDDSPTALRSAEAILEGYRFANGTIYDRLNSAGLDWRIVEGDALPQALSLAGMVEGALSGRFISMSDLAQSLAQPAFHDRYVFIEPHYGHVLADGSNFKCGNSQHPLDDVTRGEQFLKSVYEMIRNSPHWERSLLVVTYDEHGGFFDHVPPPPASPPGDGPYSPGNNRHGFDFTQLGVRVPAVVISPFTQRGLIDHSTHDHTAILATLEALFDLPALTERDAAAASLSPLFSLPEARTDAPAVLPPPAASGAPDCEEQEGRLAASLSAASAELEGRLDSALVGFLHVALARELHLAAVATGDVEGALAKEKDRLLQAYHGIESKFDAARYLHAVAQRYEAFRQH